MRRLSVPDRRLTVADERELVAGRPSAPRGSRGDRVRARRERAVSPAWLAWLASDARRTLIECNVPLALKVAGECRDRRLGDDRFGIALLALCRAADGFDPDKGRFTTYLKHVVVRALWRDKADEYLVIHVPTDIRDLVHRIDRGLPVELRRPTILALVGPARAAMAVARLRGPSEWGEWGGGGGDFRADQVPDHRGLDPSLSLALLEEARS